MHLNTLETLTCLSSETIASLMSVDLDRQYWVRRQRLSGRSLFGRHGKHKVRVICEPHKSLKDAQSKIAKAISARATPHSIAQAYTKSRSIITNAERHLGAKTVLHIDLVNFFGFINKSRVYEALVECFEELPASDVKTLADICCRMGHLPQGSPASPILSNLACAVFDQELEKFARSIGCAVTRYSDDITFSTAECLLPPELASTSDGTTALGQPLLAIIKRHGFEVNWGKVRLETSAGGIKVTGLMVGPTVAVRRKFRDDIRARLRCWSKHGIRFVSGYFGPEGSPDAFVQSLKGSIEFVGQVMGKDSAVYRRFAGTFSELVERDMPQGVM